MSSVHHCTACRSILDSNKVALDVSRDCLDQGDLLGGRKRRTQESRVTQAQAEGDNCGQQAVVRSIDDWVEIAAVHGKRNADAHVARGLSDGSRLGRKIRQALHARVMGHHRADPSDRGAAESERQMPARDRRPGSAQIRQPSFQGHVKAADLAQPRHPGVIMSIGERREGKSACGTMRTLLDRRDPAVNDP